MKFVRDIALVLTACILFTLIATSAAGYSLSPSTSQGTIDIVDREINNELGSATISSVSSIDGDDSVSVEVGVDAEEVDPNLQVRDQENSILRLSRNVKDGSVQTFDSSVFAPSRQSETTAGTYSISLWFDGEAVAAHPVVVQGYDISITAPSTIGPTESANITADISKRDIPKNSNPESVELTIGNENIALQKATSITDDSGEYSFEIDASKLDSQDYNVYISVRGDEKVLGENELLAIGQASTLTVTESGGSGGDDGSGGSGGDDGSGGSGGDDGSNNPNETDETNETTASNITISNVSLEPDTVGNDQDEHTLSFDVSNVSTDGNADKFSISIPERVTIENVEDVRINNSEYDPNATPTNNTIEFSVNPSNATHPENLSIQLDLRLST